MSRRVRLGVNIDHVATVRNARGGRHPDPAHVAELAISAGADGITAHLREDRRHIGDADIDRLMSLSRTTGVPLNLEMAVTDEMLAIALRHRPHAVCLVPERREERTTEGGLDVASGHNRIAPFVQRLADSGARVSLFIAADPAQLRAAEATAAAVVELHVGAWCDAVRDGREAEASAALTRLREAAVLAGRAGLEVHAGHGLDYDTARTLAATPQIVELNIGHFLIGEALSVGLPEAIARMRAAIDEGARGDAA